MLQICNFFSVDFKTWILQTCVIWQLKMFLFEQIIRDKLVVCNKNKHEPHVLQVTHGNDNSFLIKHCILFFGDLYLIIYIDLFL